MKIPNPENAIVDDQKLIGYCLNITHAEGQHKARVFKSALNLGSEDVAILKAALLQAVKSSDAVLEKRNQYGQKYVIDFSMMHDRKSAIIHSVWIVKDNENIPRLITCYVF